MSKTFSISMAVLALLVAAPAAQAEKVEVGGVQNASAPTCPGTPTRPCIVVTHTTGFQAKIGDTKDYTYAPKAGRLVSFSVTTGTPDESQISALNADFGGGPRVRIAVLKPSRDRKRYKLTGQSEVQDLTPFLGGTAEFPLVETLEVDPGDVIGLTVPTWAPVLATPEDRKDAWRASRAGVACDDTQAQSAMQNDGMKAPFACLYRAARVTYSATVISTP